MKLKKMQKGGAAEGHSDAFWNGNKWIKSSDGATYNNGVFYANGGSTASFYVDGNGRPVPFAMAPGSGQGSGYLQDLPTHMNYGGAIPGAQLVNPFAMNPGPGTGGGMLQDLPTEMKKGGQWIQKATANMRTDHPCTGSKFGSSSCPPGSKRYNLAQTFKAMHHENGGPVFMEDAGFFQGDPSKSAFNANGQANVGQPQQIDDVNAGYNATVAQGDPTGYSANYDNRNKYLNHNVPGVTSDSIGPDGSPNSSGTAPAPPQQPQQGGRGWGYAAAGFGALGAGMGITSYLSDQRDQRNLRNKNFNDRSTANQYAAYNGQDTMGNYDIYGALRPQNNTVTRPGYFPTKMGQYGGQFAMGGNYQAGSEHELDEQEIARLQRMGYKLQFV